MTCREKLAMEHPDKIDPEKSGGCVGCPSEYGYSSAAAEDCDIPCTECWDREMPEEKDKSVFELKKEIQLDDINDIFEFLGELVINHGIPVSIFVSDQGTSININPHLVDKGDEEKC